MSRTIKRRTSRVIKTVKAPGKFKVAVEFLVIDTCINDLNTLKKILSEMGYHHGIAGTIGKAGYATIDVGNRITNEVGYEVVNGKLQFKSTPKGKYFINSLMQKYNLEKIKNRLRDQGYGLKRKNENVLEASKIENGEKRVIEITIDDESVEVESKNFENSEKCKEAVEQFEDIIGNDVIEDYDTFNYSDSGCDEGYDDESEELEYEQEQKNEVEREIEH